jgi:hypothetical protein
LFIFHGIILTSSYIRSVFLVLLFHLSIHGSAFSSLSLSLSLSLIVSVYFYSMCSVVSDTPQKGHSGDRVFSMTCLCVARVYSILSLDTTTSFFLLRLVESSFHSIASFLNLLVLFSPCARLSCLFFASVFFIQLIRSYGGYNSRSLLSSSNAFFAAPSALSFPVISEWRTISYF